MLMKATTAAAIVALTALLSLSGGARELLPRAVLESVGLDSARLRAATAFLNEFAADRKIAGAVAAVARRGKLAYMEAVAFQNLDTRAPMTERTLFRIYSMTKPVTAVAA